MFAFFKKYKSSGVATVLSFVGSSIFVAGIVMFIVSILGGSIDIESLVFILGGLVVNFIAQAMAKSAQKKKRRKKSKKKK